MVKKLTAKKVAKTVEPKKKAAKTKKAVAKKVVETKVSSTAIAKNKIIADTIGLWMFRILDNKTTGNNCSHSAEIEMCKIKFPNASLLAKDMVNITKDCHGPSCEEKNIQALNKFSVTEKKRVMKGLVSCAKAAYGISEKERFKLREWTKSLGLNYEEVSSELL